MYILRRSADSNKKSRNISVLMQWNNFYFCQNHFYSDLLHIYIYTHYILCNVFQIKILHDWYCQAFIILACRLVCVCVCAIPTLLIVLYHESDILSKVYLIIAVTSHRHQQTPFCARLAEPTTVRCSYLYCTQVQNITGLYTSICLH